MDRSWKNHYDAEMVGGVELPDCTIYEMMLRHARAQVDTKMSAVAVCQMRKHIAWYTAGLAGSAALRARINTASSYEELEKILTEWYRSVS